MECGDFTTSNKIQDKWLGDILHHDGLAASTEATIKERTPRVKAAIFEIKGKIEVFRSQCIGGAVGAPMGTVRAINVAQQLGYLDQNK